ncbi:hypothetical protein FRC06_004400 [Ceratobasidium sp. 370]|nr:hypothetical protein FRC06_004400 [Ceratobasidium sp. 370]
MTRPTRKRSTLNRRLQQLQAEAARLQRMADASNRDTPRVLERRDVPAPLIDETYRFRTEAWNQEDPAQACLRPREGYIHLLQRTCNSWALLDATTKRMVTPEFRAREDPDDHNVYDLVGFMSPLNDGARRASRALSGYTPLYAQTSHPDLWQMQTKFMRVQVLTPRTAHVHFFGNMIPCVVFPSATSKEVEYVVQTPDRYFKPYWEAATARWAVAHAQGEEQRLVTWQDLDLDGPRPWFLNKWAVTVLRLEHGKPATHPDDPARPAMLGNCRLATRARDLRAPTTEAEWLEIPVEDCDPNDDEAGESDAGSINDDVERGLPTCHDWDPETKKSRSGRGTEPHPHPDVVAQELARNEAWDELAAAAGTRSDSEPTEAGRAAAPVQVEPAGPGGAMGEPVDLERGDAANANTNPDLASPFLGSDIDAPGEVDPDVPGNSAPQLPALFTAPPQINTTQPTVSQAPSPQPAGFSSGFEPVNEPVAPNPQPEPIVQQVDAARARPIYFVPPRPGSSTVRAPLHPRPDSGMGIRERSRGFTEELE